MDAALPDSHVWTWKLLDLETKEAAAQAKAIVSDLCLQDERASLDHDLLWLLDGGVRPGIGVKDLYLYQW